MIKDAMRTVKNPQLQLGGTSIEKIKINLKSRDDIPPLLLGLQYVYTNIELRNKVFEILEQNIKPDTDNNNGLMEHTGFRRSSIKPELGL